MEWEAGIPASLHCSAYSRRGVLLPCALSPALSSFPGCPAGVSSLLSVSLRPDAPIQMITWPPCARPFGRKDWEL